MNCARISVITINDTVSVYVSKGEDIAELSGKYGWITLVIALMILKLKRLNRLMNSLHSDCVEKKMHARHLRFMARIAHSEEGNV